MSSVSHATEHNIGSEAPLYFASPISTLLESREDENIQHITLHDLAEAYSLFVNRIERIAVALSDVNCTSSALRCVKENALVIAQCLRRDIGRAFIDPFPENSQLDPMQLSQEASLKYMKLARDLTLVSQHALQVVACLFRFPALMSAFQRMLDDVLAVITTPLPTPNSSKTRAIAIWTLSVLNLPIASLHARRRQLCDTIQKTIASSDVDICVADGMQPQLSTLIVSALESNCQQTVGRGPSWACVVLASLVILSDRQCFTHTRTIRLIVRSLAHSKRHQQRSEHRYGVGVALAAYLLSLPPGDALFGDQLLSSTVLAVAKRMVEDEDEIVHAEGKSVLLRLVSAIGTSTIQSSTTSIVISKEHGCPEDILVEELLDGTVLKADEEHLSTIITTTGKLDVTCIRQYAEVEIVQHWSSLLEIWLSCVRRSASQTSMDNPLDSHLLHIWQALLLVHAQLTQEFGHLTTPPGFANRLVDIISQVMHPASDALPNVQLVLLTLLKQLVVLSQHYDLTQEDVKTCWGDICASLILADSPEILHKLATSNEAANEAELTRALVVALSEGLYAWIRDEGEILTEDEYNRVIAPLYQSTLHRLRGLSAPADVLHVLAPFLCSAFGHIPSPALGPAAFKDFWDHIRPTLRPDQSIPAEIKKILVPCYEFLEGTVPPDVLIYSESQSQSQYQTRRIQSVVPETPPMEFGNDTTRLVEDDVVMADAHSPVSHSERPPIQQTVDNPDDVVSTIPTSEHVSNDVGQPLKEGGSPDAPLFPSPREVTQPGSQEQEPTLAEDPVDVGSSSSPAGQLNQRSVSDTFRPSASRRDWSGGRNLELHQRNRAQSDPIPESSHSGVPQSLPTMRKRALRTSIGSADHNEDAGRSDPDRPPKRARLGSSPPDSARTEPHSPTRPNSSPTASPSPQASSASSSFHPAAPAAPGDISPTFTEIMQAYEAASRSTRPSPSAMSPEYPPPSPRSRYAAEPASDDDATWETGVDPAEEREQMPDDAETDDDEDEDDDDASMRTDEPDSPHPGAGPRSTVPPRRGRTPFARRDSMLVVPSSEDGEEDPAFPPPAPAPSSSSRPAARPGSAHPHPLRRTRRSSAHLEELQRVCAALQEEDGADMDLQELEEAMRLVHGLDGWLKESLLRRLAQTAGAPGAGKGKGKSKSKAR
ncbi:hypothetical protein POSPLADRAFT_1048228 [Postia placenta MAD-698-R-SB12]|uniref:Telomere-associated protein Rif1 N-terminal domain-containing protein n=1 Tax=Postia placenta MAD-698-R-SB12 TaxID=670580 RepID=A0A1X6MU13_9APHY|nr:hypothetical protein POSPLADRAFT_1048228 [Postia placenta MAD-698-R-SB12]OSX59750.1 hypothetical protein POSPLADRAFT_1048228 [Postia placenta MAD-698-R-SB12]